MSSNTSKSSPQFFDFVIDTAHVDDCFLRMCEVRQKTGLSKSAIYRAIDVGEFPQPVKIGKKSIAWRKSVINAWMAYVENSYRNLNFSTQSNENI